MLSTRSITLSYGGEGNLHWENVSDKHGNTTAVAIGDDERWEERHYRSGDADTLIDIINAEMMKGGHYPRRQYRSWSTLHHLD